MAENYKKYSDEEIKELSEKLAKVAFKGLAIAGNLVRKGVYCVTKPKNYEDIYPKTKFGKIRQTIHELVETNEEKKAKALKDLIETNKEKKEEERKDNFAETLKDLIKTSRNIKQASLNRKEELQKKINIYGFVSVADCFNCHHRWAEFGKPVNASFCPKCKEANKNKILVREIKNADDLYAPINV